MILRIVAKNGTIVDLTMADNWNFMQGMAMAKLHGFFATEHFFIDYDNAMSFGIVDPKQQWSMQVAEGKPN